MENMDPKELDRLIEKYLEGKCTDDERRLIDSLYSSLDAAGSGASALPSEERMNGAEERILRGLNAHAQETQSRRRYLWRYAGIAASLICLLSTGYYFTRVNQQDPETILATNAAKDFEQAENMSSTSKRLILPDGSIVRMGPNSRVRFTTDVEGPTRELFLEGEAYFDIAHNNARPFYVYAGNVVTKVLGTSFIVRARNSEQVTVSVKTGKVSVYSKKTSHKKTVLTPNQEAVYDGMTDLVATQEASVSAPTEIEVAPPLTEMHFEETQVSDVLRSLTKTYAIEVDFDEKALSGCVITSSFYDEGLYDRIDVICTAIGATYKIVDARIIIESKGCNLKTD